MRVGVFGGAFNPIHIGHLNTASEVMIKMSLTRIYFVVSARPPHKEADTLIDFTHRLRMAEIATKDNKAFAVSNIEKNREGPSYTIDTMRHFHEKYGKDVYFIAGQDAMEDIGSWRSAKTLLETCNFIVVTRPGHDPATLKDVLQSVLAVRYKNLKLKVLAQNEFEASETLGVVGALSTISIVKVTALDISSSAIRENLKRGAPVGHLVPAQVEAYCKKENIFKK